MLEKQKMRLEGGIHQTFPGKGHMTTEKEEFQRLQKENRRLRTEHIIFKKNRGLLCERVNEDWFGKRLFCRYFIIDNFFKSPHITRASMGNAILERIGSKLF